MHFQIGMEVEFLYSHMIKQNAIESCKILMACW
ncbi:hypothetical protein EMIT0P43_30053 [Pseudomonas jessenii]